MTSTLPLLCTSSDKTKHTVNISPIFCDVMTVWINGHTYMQTDTYTNIYTNTGLQRKLWGKWKAGRFKDPFTGLEIPLPFPTEGAGRGTWKEPWKAETQCFNQLRQASRQRPVTSNATSENGTQVSNRACLLPLRPRDRWRSIQTLNGKSVN